jgi:glycylpeptide N-tetradecanoyltransferase
LKKIQLVEQASAGNHNRSAPKSEEEAASRQEWRFWHTQPVPSIGTRITSENNGPVEENKPVDQLRQEPYNLPDGFTWDEIDVLDDEQVNDKFAHARQ